jgi:hypothetical protein
MISTSEIISPRLRSILDEEIARGNQIVETFRGWPNPKSLILCLEKEFLSPVAKTEGIEYRKVDDPHYWKAEYHDPAEDHTLACKFNIRDKRQSLSRHRQGG